MALGHGWGTHTLDLAMAERGQRRCRARTRVVRRLAEVEAG